jgi:hypothetical protein
VISFFVKMLDCWSVTAFYQPLIIPFVSFDELVSLDEAYNLIITDLRIVALSTDTKNPIL